MEVLMKRLTAPTKINRKYEQELNQKRPSPTIPKCKAKTLKEFRIWQDRYERKLSQWKGVTEEEKLLYLIDAFDHEESKTVEAYRNTATEMVEDLGETMNLANVCNKIAGLFSQEPAGRYWRKEYKNLKERQIDPNICPRISGCIKLVSKIKN
jgi:hypothetical protein